MAPPLSGLDYVHSKGARSHPITWKEGQEIRIHGINNDYFLHDYFLYDHCFFVQIRPPEELLY